MFQCDFKKMFKFYHNSISLQSQNFIWWMIYVFCIRVWFIQMPKIWINFMEHWYLNIYHILVSSIPLGFVGIYGNTCICNDVSPSLPSAAYMRHWTVLVLVQVMACRLFGAKPLSESTLTQLDPLKQIWVKFKSKYKNFHSWKCIWKCLRNGGYFVQEHVLSIQFISK